MSEFSDYLTMAYDVSPAARALLALEVIQDNPGITAQQLGDRLGVSDRAARRYVAILREAELPRADLTADRGVRRGPAAAAGVPAAGGQRWAG
jgi:predicted DNA-binding transcriptional regulator YafY